MPVSGKIFGCGLVVFLLLSGCELNGEKAISNPARASVIKVETSEDAKQSVAVQRTPDGELIAQPPSSPISLIEVENPPRTDLHPPRPFLEVKHATGGGILRFDGPCLFLESGTDRVGLVFKNASARFDVASNELLVAGVRVRVGDTMFVRALWWGGPSFSGFALKPPLADECTRNHFWIVDTVGVGTPTSEDLNCQEEVEPGRAPKITMEPFVVQGGLEQQAEQTFRQWQRNFGIVRVCVEKHLPQRIGTLIDQQVTVNISENGHVSDIAFQENPHAGVVECMKGYLAETTPFPPVQQASELALRLRVQLGNSDYQIATCDHLRRHE